MLFHCIRQPSQTKKSDMLKSLKSDLRSITSVNGFATLILTNWATPKATTKLKPLLNQETLTEGGRISTIDLLVLL